MRTLWPNLDGEEGLETVLEVPLPNEMFSSKNHNSWRTIKSWLRPQHHRRSSDFRRRAIEIQFLLGVLGAPFIHFPIFLGYALDRDNIKSHPIERSMASYIVQQYIAAAGGKKALDSIESMCVIGKVKMGASEMEGGEDLRGGKMKKGELGGFVLWQKRPHLWSLELMLSGLKISAGCDGTVAWRQSPWQPSRASRGPARPLRRSLQGLDPRATADLFSNSICIGEKAINGEDCFVLKKEAESRSSTEIAKHTVWGCFSQRTGLLVQLEDCHSLRAKSPRNQVLFETRMESFIQDYKTIDGVNIAHGGRTSIFSFGFGDDVGTRMEEVWSIEEVDFDVKGLSKDFFSAPKAEEEECGGGGEYDGDDNGGLRYKVLDNCSSRRCGSRGGTKVVAIDEESLELCDFD